MQSENMIRRLLTGCVTSSSEQLLGLRTKLNNFNVNKRESLNQTFMGRKEILVSPETWQDIPNSSKHLNQLVEINGELTCNLGEN